MHNFGEEKLNHSKSLLKNFQKNIIVNLLRKCNQYRIRKVIKKLVDWCDLIRLCLQLLYGNKKTKQMFYWLWKCKSNTLINNHFIIKYKVHGMVPRRSRRLVPWYSFFQLLFILYYNLLAMYTEINATLNNLFVHEY